MRSYNYHSPGPDDDYSHVRIGNRTVVDFVPADMLHLVPDHWYKFPPMEPYHHTLLGIAMTLMAIISIIGNGLVIYLFTTVKNLRSPTNLLVANLAFSDFCMMLNQSTIMAYNCFAQAWALGPLWCDLYAMWGSLFGNASIWSLVLISRDRYNAIVKGIAGEPLTYGKATLQITCIWVIALAWTVGPIFGWGRYVPEGNMTACALDYLTRDWKTLSYVVIYPCFVYFTPLFIILYSYFHIVKAVFEHERTLREQAKKMNVASLRNNANENKESQEIRIAKVALMTVSLWFIAWTPYLAIAWTGVFTDGELLTPLFTVWGGVLCKSAACYNPIIYAISHPKFKAALANMFCSSKGEKSLITDATSETGKSVAMTEVSAVSG